MARNLVMLALVLMLAYTARSALAFTMPCMRSEYSLAQRCVCPPCSHASPLRIVGGPAVHTRWASRVASRAVS
eukprot:32384-Eustigmatos_ZCMA.PRE.1